MELSPQVRKFGAWITIVGGCAGIAAFAIPYAPQPVFAGDLIPIVKELRDTQREVYNDQLDRNQLRLHQNLREQRNYSTQPVPDQLLQELTDLQAQKRRLEQKLRDLNEN